MFFRQKEGGGEGVEKDLAQAAKWYRKAAEYGDPWAQNALDYIEKEIEKEKLKIGEKNE